MSQKKRYFLEEDEIPRNWYNIQADMPVKPMPPLNPQTREPMKAEDLYPIFARECCDQELNMTDRWIPIPDEVREMYKYYRSTPLVRAAMEGVAYSVRHNLETAKEAGACANSRAAD